jgi:hypothetical protein
VRSTRIELLIKVFGSQRIPGGELIPLPVKFVRRNGQICNPKIPIESIPISSEDGAKVSCHVTAQMMETIEVEREREGVTRTSDERTMPI